MAETKESKPKEERPSGKKAAKPKFEANKPLSTSVRSYQRGINAQKQRMADASRKFGANVKSLSNDIKAKIRADKESVSRFRGNVHHLSRECRSLSREFQSYARGPVADYVNAFWGR